MLTTTRSHPAPAAWIDQANQPHRACLLCVHGTTGIDHRRLCRHTQVARGASALPVHVARAPTGACGPEAVHLDFPGLHRP